MVNQKKTKRTVESITREELLAAYVNNPTASKTVACKILDCSEPTFRAAMKKHGLSMKPRGAHSKVEIPQLSDREWLAQQLEGKTLLQVAKELGTTVGRIADRAYRYGIRSKSMDKSAAVRAGIKLANPEGRFGENASHWKGGVRKSSGGYIQVYMPTHPYATKAGYVMEHRLVMEKKLGRLMDPREIAHHVDGDKRNNDPDNLELKTSGEHIREHFEASHEVKGWRKHANEQDERIKKLEDEVEQLKQQLTKLLTL